ncbi:MAG: hypothetical protein COA78_17975 [Blastopirellula sp.]|nr:MAG: hypothetical protein COA78_17975 [Blastopirellula sp.]
MARPKLVSPDQPLFVRFVLRLYELGASLQLAVFMLFSMAGTLALATAVEATFSTAVVQFAVYQSWWFNLMYCLLAVNIFCAASIRYPWKKHQTGFVITHIGLMTLLFSGVVSRIKGIDSQVHVWENSSSSLAFDDSYYFRLETTPKSSADPHAGSSDLETVQKTIQPIAFKPGAFSWSDYQDGFSNQNVANSKVAKFFSPLFYLAKRNDSGDVLYHKDGVKLEVIDFYSDADWKRNTPTVELRIGMPSVKQADSQGRMKESKPQWVPAELSVRFVEKGKNYHQHGFGDDQKRGGGSFTFSMVGTHAATEAFLKSAPEGKIGAKGQVVLLVQGKRLVIDVKQAMEQEPIEIEGTNFKYQISEYLNNATAVFGEEDTIDWIESQDQSKTNPSVKIKISRNDKDFSQLVLHADAPQLNLQAYDADIYGDFWFDHGEKTSAQLLQGEGGSRIDIIQGLPEGVTGEEADLVSNKRLYYRYWNRKEVVFAKELPIHGNPENAVDAFSMKFGTVKMYIKKFIPSDRPKGQPVAIPFAPGKPFMQPAAKVRLTIEGEEEPEEFWLMAHYGEPTSGYAEGQTRKTIDLGDKVISLAMPIKSTDIGFRIYLEKFERKLDPGTTQASHFSSDVHYLDSRRDRKIMTAGGAYRTPHPLLIQGMVNPSSPVIDGNKIYWIDNGNVSGRSILMAERSEGSSNAYGMATEIISFAAFDPQTIVIDSVNEKIYWTDHRSSQATDLGLIREANLDGSEVRTVATFAGKPQGLAVDSKKGIVFFTDNSSGNIGRVLTDGSELNPDWITEKGHATGVAIDPVNELVYWSDDEENTVRYATYAGEYKKAVYHGTPGQGKPNSLSIDVKKQVLYWTDIAPNPINPNAAKYRNDRTIDRDIKREKLTRVRRLVLDEKEPKNISVKLLDNPGDAFFDAASGQLYWTQTDLLKSDVWVTMNAPDMFVDPTYGRQLRVFQESFNGPFGPGTESYRANVPVSSNVPEVFRSVFSVNYDPGTPLRYWGCFLVCTGIATMFYMRAYFFPAKRKTNSTT